MSPLAWLYPSDMDLMRALEVSVLWLRLTMQQPLLSVLVRTPGMGCARLRTLLCLRWFQHTLDHIIDGQIKMPIEGKPRDYFDQAERLCEALLCPQDIADEVALPLMATLVYVLRACSEQLGFDPRPELQAIWHGWHGDAERVLNKEPFADEATLSAAHNASVEIVELMLRIMDVPASITQSVRLHLKLLLDADNLDDFASDVRDGNLQFPREEFERAGIDPDQLLACAHPRVQKTRECLTALPGFYAWLRSRVAACEQLQNVTDAAIVLSYIQPKWLRGYVRRHIQQGIQKPALALAAYSETHTSLERR